MCVACALLAGACWLVRVHHPAWHDARCPFPGPRILRERHAPLHLALHTPTHVHCCSWGSAQGGRLGTGMFEDALFPEMLPDLDGEHMVGLACGLDHSLVLVCSGR